MDKKQKIIRYLQSFLAIPMLAVTIPLTGISSSIKMNVVPTINTNENSVIITQEEVNRTKKAYLINSFFAKNEAPLEGYGMKFVVEAEKNNIDWRLLPAIAMRETTGGKYSCKKGFKTVDQSIEFISQTISGNNPTSKYYHDKMNTEEILKKYNPDYIIPGYSKQVIKIMTMIDPAEKII